MSAPSLEIGELGEAGFDLSLTGFDEFELGELFAERIEGTRLGRFFDESCMWRSPAAAGTTALRAVSHRDLPAMASSHRPRGSG
jgi:hypothetical protein